MYAKSFLVCNHEGRLIDARTALRYPSAVYTCHHCSSVLVLHDEDEHPWFEHIDAVFTVQGRQRCPYLHSAVDEVHFIHQLRRYVPGARPLVSDIILYNPVYDSHDDGEWEAARELSARQAIVLLLMSYIRCCNVGLFRVATDSPARHRH